MTVIDQELDLKGLNCPLPILRIKQTISRMESGEVLRIVGTEPGTERELKIFCKQGGHEYLDYQESGNEFIYTLRKG
jgi:tRNA 2-thiouridine synthesizing protein A